MTPPLLVGKNIVKTYFEAQHSVDILHAVNIDVHAGETLAILGASGSGKSTLLHILGTLDTPNSGDVLFKGKSLLTLSKTQQASFRNSELGFVYQFHHLLPEFSATENVAMPKLIAGVAKKEAYASAHKLLDRVGLSHRLNHKPHQLSGGERQRVAIARAMVNSPSIIMADEPTGNLDNDASAEILKLINDINKSENTCFIIVTHDHGLASKMDRTLTLVNGNFTHVRALGE
ncbi:MAG: lipoprotein-releasing system ATP-binding protein [Alphaproteobacteria bacterium]|jgi:lipoprotein-releasing system ATP-binding protein